MNLIEPEVADEPYGMRSSAGKLFGAAGGMTEALMRTIPWISENKEPSNLKNTELRGSKGVKETSLKIGKTKYKFLVISGLSNAIPVIEEIRAGNCDYDFIEIMACPGGCINGGGQPIGADEHTIKARMKALYSIDEKEIIRVSHKNPRLIELYKDFLGEPLGKDLHYYCIPDIQAEKYYYNKPNMYSSPGHKKLLITLKDRCRVCYTCVRECPAKAIKIINGQAEVLIERCIGCGNCTRVCSQGAKVYARSGIQVADMLESPGHVVAIVAPSFPAEFTEISDYRQFCGDDEETWL
jgi:ferredoxin